MKTLNSINLNCVKWKDLTKLTTKEVIIENTISLPWLVASLILAYYKFYLLALPCSFLFFLTGLRHSHNGFQYSLGLHKKATRIVLHINSILMLAAMHAVKHNHLMHHKHCLQKHDVEGKCAKMKGWQALLYGPIFIYKQHTVALMQGSKQTTKMVFLEILAMISFVFLVIYLKVSFLKYHVLVMLVGEFLTAFFAVWTVHHDCNEEVCQDH
jgi:hypothetical protein